MLAFVNDMLQNTLEEMNPSLFGDNLSIDSLQTNITLYLERQQSDSNLTGAATSDPKVADLVIGGVIKPILPIEVNKGTILQDFVEELLKRINSTLGELKLSELTKEKIDQIAKDCVSLIKQSNPKDEDGKEDWSKVLDVQHRVEELKELLSAFRRDRRKFKIIAASLFVLYPLFCIVLIGLHLCCRLPNVWGGTFYTKSNVGILIAPALISVTLIFSVIWQFYQNAWRISLYKKGLQSVDGLEKKDVSELKKSFSRYIVRSRGNKCIPWSCGAILIVGFIALITIAHYIDRNIVLNNSQYLTKLAIAETVVLGVLFLTCASCFLGVIRVWRDFDVEVSVVRDCMEAGIKETLDRKADNAFNPDDILQDSVVDASISDEPQALKVTR